MAACTLQCSRDLKSLAGEYRVMSFGFVLGDHVFDSLSKTRQDLLQCAYSQNTSLNHGCIVGPYSLGNTI